MSDRSAGELVGELVALGVRLWEEDGKLRFRAPAGVLTAQRRAGLSQQRDAVLDVLRAAAGPAAAAHPEQRHEPFPLTDMQSAYLLGKGSAFAYGGAGCHGYGELEFTSLDVGRLETAWNELIARHDMLRAVLDATGSQRVLPGVPRYEIAVTGAGDSEFDAAAARARAGMDHTVYPGGQWPLFGLRVTRSPRRCLLHFSIDFLICDFVSIQILLDELAARYHRPERPLPPLDITFRDYLQAERACRSGPKHDADRDYWLARVDAQPPAPELPLAPSPHSGAPPRFHRHALMLNAIEWSQLRDRAGRHGLTASGAVLAAYAEVIGTWSRQPSFTIDVTLLNRMPLHPQSNALVGDFTSVSLLAVRREADEPFTGRAKTIQASLWEGLDHRLFSGIDVIREIARRRGAAAALMPVVFTSAIGLGDGSGDADAASGTAVPPLGTLGYGISQTPQVWIDCQNIERDGGLSTNWDVRDGVFPDGMAADMFAAYAGLLRQLAAGDEAWESLAPVTLPPAQRQRRAAVNGTAAPAPGGLLHEGVLAQALRTPDAPVLVASGTTLTYGDLLGRACAAGAALRAAGCAPGDLVAVVAGKGWQQIVAVLGTLIAGAAYVPIDTSQPPARRDAILASARIRLVLTQDSLTAGWPAECQIIAVDQLAGPAPTALPAPLAGPGDLAYVIHTSGSTGTPKGVMISHRAALNTVRDIDARFGVHQGDAVLGLASLGFDLSVYDIFGPPACGARLILPSPQRGSDPTHWADLIATHGVTLWNSVPAQLQMLSDYLHAVPDLALPSLRLAMISGDWVPVSLPGQIRGRLPGLRLVSLGGATEAAIWSIYHPIGEVDPGRPSIPYGTPLLNQTWHVLDASLRPRPDWVTGELYIGGTGLAEGYLHDPDRTAERFITGPATGPAAGERLYRTGDLGRYWPDGSIEFLGREDFQVKIRGHRIELAEIETALQEHPAVADCAVVLAGDPSLDRRLEAFAVPARRPAPPLPDLAPAAAAAGQQLLRDVELPAYLDYLYELDQIALRGMLAAFQHSGLFTDPAEAHSLAGIYDRAGVAARHRRLARRFLHALAAEGLISADGGSYRLAGQHRPNGARLMDPDQDWRWAGALARAAGQHDDELLGYFRASAQRLPGLLRGEEDAARLLFPEGRLERSDALYSGTLFNRWACQTVAAIAGQLAAAGASRILEVGAGAGGTSAGVLDALAGTGADYLLTDLSPFFVDEARRRFTQPGPAQPGSGQPGPGEPGSGEHRPAEHRPAEHSGVRFATFDLDADFRPQGLLPSSVDLIVAGDVLHATRDVPATLARLRELLAPGGWLVLAEMTRDHYQIMASLEFLVRLDAHAGDFADFRRGTDRTFLDTGQWRAALTGAGAEIAVCQIMTEAGMCVIAARFKADQAPLRAPELTSHLAGRLPGYMVPAGIQIVDALPRGTSGKLDRAALAQWLQAAPDTTAGGEAPRTDLEKRLAVIWAEVLGADQVGRDQSFFDLRGDSLQAARLAGRLIEEVPEAGTAFFDEILRQVLDRPTIAELAAYLADPAAAAAAGASAMVDAETAGPAGLVPLGGLGSGRYLLMHDATGSLSGHPRLLAALRTRGQVHGVPDDFLRRRLATPPQLLIGALAADVAAVTPRGEPVHVAGYRAGGVLAMEVARQLTEAGVEVTGLTIAEPLAGAGLTDDIREAFSHESGDPAPAPDDPEQRLASLAAVLAAAAEPADLYAGDITLILPPADLPGQPDPVAWWTASCLGAVRVHRLAQHTAAAIGQALAGGRP